MELHLQFEKEICWILLRVPAERQRAQAHKKIKICYDHMIVKGTQDEDRLLQPKEFYIQSHLGSRQFGTPSSRDTSRWDQSTAWATLRSA